MPSLAPSLPDSTALRQMAHRVGGIGALLSRGIGRWAKRERSIPLPILARTRATRLVTRLQAILALLAAGRLPAVRLPAVRPPRPPPLPGPAIATAEGQGTPPPRPRAPSLPRRPGWLVPHAVEIGWAAIHLRHWLAEPATRAVLAEIPQARRPLAALCRMLAIPPWPHEPLGKPPPPAPRVREPRTRDTLPTPAEDAGEDGGEDDGEDIWYHRSIETEDGLCSPIHPWWRPRKRR